MGYIYQPVNEDWEKVNDAFRDIEVTIDSGIIFNPSFINSWVDFGSPNEPVGFRKDGNSIVHLEGCAKSGTIGQAIFTLPVLHRPANTLTFSIVSNSVFGILTIEADGDVIPISPSNNTSVFLDGIYFTARQ